MKKTDGGYIQVPYVPGAALVNLGALMQQWTSDKYMATVSQLTLSLTVCDSMVLVETQGASS